MKSSCAIDAPPQALVRACATRSVYRRRAFARLRHNEAVSAGRQSVRTPWAPRWRNSGNEGTPQERAAADVAACAGARRGHMGRTERDARAGPRGSASRQRPSPARWRSPPPNSACSPRSSRSAFRSSPPSPFWVWPRSVLGVVAVRYLGADGGRAFLIVGVSVVGAFFGPVWAGVALAGYLLGAGEGAFAAAVACVIVEALGIGLGQTGRRLSWSPVDRRRRSCPSSRCRSRCSPRRGCVKSFAALGPDSVNQRRRRLRRHQPAAAARGAAGDLGRGRRRQPVSIRAEARRRQEQRRSSLAAAAAGASVPALGAALVFSIAGIPIPWTTLRIAFVSSAADRGGLRGGVGARTSPSSARRRQLAAATRCPWRPRTPTSTSCFGSSPPPRTSLRASTPTDQGGPDHRHEVVLDA